MRPAYAKEHSVSYCIEPTINLLSCKHCQFPTYISKYLPFKHNILLKDEPTLFMIFLICFHDNICRVITESVSCIEALLNQAYERNAVLESEVDEIENLRVKLQRATDEARGNSQTMYVLYYYSLVFCDVQVLIPFKISSKN